MMEEDLQTLFWLTFWSVKDSLEAEEKAELNNGSKELTQCRQLHQSFAYRVQGLLAQEAADVHWWTSAESHGNTTKDNSKFKVKQAHNNGGSVLDSNPTSSLH